LCESEAARVNECYLKFVTSGIPFIHGVVVCAEAGTSSTSDWSPSRRFLELACEYDMIGLGHDAKINGMVLNACLSRKRHRQLVVAGATGDVKLSVPDIQAGNASFVRVEPQAEQEAANQPGLALMLSPPADCLNVTSALILPGYLRIHSSAILEQSDKLTVIQRRADEANSSGLKSTCSAIELDVEAARNSDSENYVEVTGYPRRSVRE